MDLHSRVLHESKLILGGHELLDGLYIHQAGVICLWKQYFPDPISSWGSRARTRGCFKSRSILFRWGRHVAVALGFIQCRTRKKSEISPLNTMLCSFVAFACRIFFKFPVRDESELSFEATSEIYLSPLEVINSGTTLNLRIKKSNRAWESERSTIGRISTAERNLITSIEDFHQL